MSNIQIFNYNGNAVTFRKGDSVMVNATEMAKPFGKRPNDFLSAKSTQELISSLSAKTGISATALVIVNQGGNNQGTWLHEDLALIFAQWLSPTFYLWCNDRIKELLQVGFTATPAFGMLLFRRSNLYEMRIFGYTIIRTKKLNWLYSKLAQLALEKIKTPRR